MNQFFINTIDGDWTKIMYHSNGILKKEVVILTGDNNNINRDFLLNLWGFSLDKILYISFDRNQNELLSAWRSSRLTPFEDEINSIRFIQLKSKYDLEDLTKTIRKNRPELVCIENMPINSDFDIVMQELKELAKYNNVGIYINVNPEFENVDNVLNSKEANKIILLSERSAYIYKSGCDEGIKVSIKHNPDHHIIFEYEWDDSEEAKQMKKITISSKCYSSQAQVQQTIKDKPKEKKEQAKEKVQEKKMTMSFGH